MKKQNNIENEIKQIMDIFDNGEATTYEQYYRQNKKTKINYFKQKQQYHLQNSYEFLQNLRQIPLEILENFKKDIHCAYQNFVSHSNTKKIQQNQTQKSNSEDTTITSEIEIKTKVSKMNQNNAQNNQSLQVGLNKSCIQENYCQLITQVLALLENHQFLYELINQIELKKKYEDLLKQHNHGKNIQFRIGSVYRDVFQGYVFEDIIKLFFILLNIYNDSLQFKFNKKKLIIKYKNRLIKNDFFGELQDYVQKLYNQNFIDQLLEDFLDKFGLSYNSQFSDNFNEIIIQIDLNNLNEQYQELDNYKEYCPPFEINNKIIVIWILSNFISNEYIQYNQHVKHFNQYILDLIGLNQVLQVDSKGKAQIIKRKHFSRQIFQEDNILLKYKELNINKQYQEMYFDFLCNFQSLNFDSLENANQLAQYIQENQINIKLQPPQNTNSNITNIFNQFYNFQLNIKSFLTIQLQIKQKFQKNVFNRIDQSMIVKTIRHFNQQFLDFLSLNSSQYKVYANPQAEFQNIEIQNSQQNKINKIQHLEQYLQKSCQTKDGLVKQIKNENDILNNIVCFDNIFYKWNNLKSSIREIADMDVDFDTPQNQFIPMQNSFSTFKLKKTETETKNYRKILPEEFIPKECWDMLYQQIQDLQWEVQNGLILWFYVFIYQQEFQYDILRLLDFLQLQKIKRRQTAIKFFGEITRFFKFISHTNQIKGFENYIKNIKDQYLNISLKLDPSILMDIETCFGNQRMSRNHNENWDTELLQHTIEWTNRNTAESIFGLDITKDFEQCLGNNFKDLYETRSLKAIESQPVNLVYIENEMDSQIIIKKLQKSLDKEKNDTILYELQPKLKTQIQYKSFYKFAENFYKFSASGSAQGAQVRLQKTKTFKKIEKYNKELYQKINSKYQNTKKTGISKTICFGYSGKYLLKFLFWVYGNNYNPYYEMNIKSEPKKLRQIVNSDLTSFSKQTYFFNWISEVLNENTKNQIHSYLTKVQKQEFFNDSLNIKNNEKWNVELDMKDFHIHFGKSHFKSFGKIIKKCVEQKVSKSQIQNDLLIIAESFKKDLGRGVINFSKILKRDDLFKGFYENDYGINIQKKNQEDDKHEYNISIPIRNGLMSGWKLTSFMGSIFNLSLNQMCQKWNLFLTGGINLNLGVMGDDIHLKKRYLHEAISHIAFTNLIGKQAHPQKQMISTVMIEFLKTKISQKQKQLKYPAVNILNQILYHKSHRTKQLQKNDFLANQVDIINMFYNRIDSKCREKLLQNNFHLQFLRFCCRLSKKEFANSEIEKFLDNPSIFNNSLPGHVRKKVYNFQDNINITDDIRVQGFNDLLKVYELRLNPKEFQGIRENVAVFTRNINFFNNNEKKEFNKKLINKIGTKIIEKKGFYTLEKNPYVQDKKLQILKMNEANVFTKNKFSYWKDIKVQILSEYNDVFDFKDFMNFSFQLFENVILKQINYQGIIGQLLYIDEQVSQIIYQMIKNQISKDEINYLKKVYQNLKGLLVNCETGFHIFYQFINKYGEDFFFFLSLQNFIKIQVSKNFIHDSLIGLIGDQLQKHLIIYMIEKIPENKIQAVKDNFLSIMCTLDHYIHQNTTEITDKIQDMFQRKQQKKCKDYIENMIQQQII